MAAITVPCMEGSAVERIIPIGTTVRAFAGNLRSAVRAEKREWQVGTHYLSNADSATLKAAVALRAQVTCSGDMLGGSVTCEVEVGDGAYPTLANDATGVMRTHVLTLREV